MSFQTFLSRIRLVAVTCTLTVLVASTAQAAGTSEEDVAPPRSLGTPLSDVLLIGGYVGTTHEDQDVVWVVSTGSPAHLNAVDPVDGSSIATYPLPGASGSYAVEQAPDGTVYVGTYGEGRLYRLAPGAETVEDLGIPVAGEGYVWDIIIDPDGIVYGGTSPGGKVFAYDPELEQFHDYGQMIAGQTYVKSIAWGEGMIYAGALADARITELDPQTGDKRELPPPPDFDIADKTVNDLNFRGGLLYARNGTAFPGPLFVYDPATNAWIDRIEGAAGLDVSPPGEDGRVWFLRSFEEGSSELVGYDPQTKEQERTGLTVHGRVVNSRGIGWADLGLSDYPGQSIVGMLWRGEVFRFNPETGTHEVFASEVRREPIEILSLAAGPGTTAYAGGFLNGGVAEVDIVTGESTFNRFSQTESLNYLDGELWIGAYPDARIYRADPDAVWNSPEYSPTPDVPENPVKIADLNTEHQNRPYGLVPANGDVFAGTIPGGDRLGGVLLEVDRETGDSTVHRDVVPDQSIVSLTSNDGVVYGSTWIFGGLSTTPPTQTTGTVFAWDAATETKLWEVEPIAGATGIPAVAVDSNGLVWGVSDGQVFALDPADGSVVHNIEVLPAENRWTIGKLELDPTTGRFYALLHGDQVVAVDPEEATAEVLFTQSARTIAVAEDGTLLFAHDTELLAWTPERDVECTTTVTGGHVGALNVSEGVTCLHDARQTGPVRVSGGAGLVVSNSTITGPVASNGASVMIVEESTVTGPITVADGTAGVRLDGSRITGAVVLQGNVGGPNVVAGNTIRGVLSCSGNDPAPTNEGAPNKLVGTARGQCANL